MREILFRGQTRRKGEKVLLDGSPVDSNWVYGGIFPNNNGGDFALIYQQEPEIHKFPVYADTVGQYTGLTDKNGNKIFEGDIVKLTFSEVVGKIICDVNYYIESDIFDRTTRKLLGDYSPYDLEILGNIHDNPELLEVQNEQG
jgi:uncharacterized phage protein (TIGR01671 family)